MGETEGETASPANHAFHRDLSTHRRHQLANDSQSQPGVAALTVPRVINAVETLEDVGNMLGRDAFFGIYY